MRGCIYRTEDDLCMKFTTDETTRFCISPCEHETPSNADRIRAMADEELAEWISQNIACSRCESIHNGHQPCMDNLLITCEGHWLDWLQRTVASDVSP